MSVQNVVKALKKAELLGTYLIPSNFHPSVTVDISYSSGVKVELGNELKKSETQSEPTVRIKPADPTAPSGRFTLALLDPDAKSKQDPCWAPFAHWMHTGLTPLGIQGPNAAAGESLIEYMGPAPPPGTDFHRYVFLLYRESSGSKLAAPKEERKNFPIADFVKKNNLELVGANFFKTKEDK